MKSKTLHYRVTLLTTVALFLIFAWGCKKDDNAELATLGSIMVSDVTSGSAVISVNIIQDGGVKISEKGVVQSTYQNPTIEVNENKLSAGTGSGEYTLTLTGLTPGTKHYVRGYATNKKGTAYGSQVEFTTEGVLAQINTMEVVEITSGGGIIRGNVTHDGGFPVTARGIVWNTSTQPTVDENEGKTTDGEGEGEFIRELKGLKPNLMYYARAYGINSAGTAYGNEVTFTTNGWIRDIDGNEYKVVAIGNQVWMAENLKTTRYNDATTVPLAYYVSYLNNTSLRNIYGILYRWNVIPTENLCPAGWHVPSNNEFVELINYIGGGAQGGKLKETGTAHWASPNTGATNETGFTAFGGGRYAGGKFDSMTANGYWWSSSTLDAGYAYRMSLGHTSTNISRTFASKSEYYSVRCLRDRP